MFDEEAAFWGETSLTQDFTVRVSDHCMGRAYGGFSISPIISNKFKNKSLGSSSTKKARTSSLSGDISLHSRNELQAKDECIGNGGGHSF